MQEHKGRYWTKATHTSLLFGGMADTVDLR